MLPLLFFVPNIGAPTFSGAVEYTLDVGPRYDFSVEIAPRYAFDAEVAPRYDFSVELAPR